MCTCSGPETQSLSDHTSSQCPPTLWLWRPDQYQVPSILCLNSNVASGPFLFILGYSHWKWKNYLIYLKLNSSGKDFSQYDLPSNTSAHFLRAPHKWTTVLKMGSKQRPIRTRAKTVPRKFPHIEISTASFKCWCHHIVSSGVWRFMASSPKSAGPSSWSSWDGFCSYLFQS